METKFIELAGEVNRRMPEYIIGKLQHALNDRGKSVKGSKLLILGLAYKKDINDDRESPAYKIIARLLEMGAKISYHDPFVPKIKHARQWPIGPTLKSQPLTTGTIVAQEQFQTNQTDFKAILTNVKAANPDFIFAPSSIATAPLLIKQARELGITATIAAGDTWETPASSNNAGADAEGIVLSTFFDENDTANPVAADFVKGFKEYLKANPESLSKERRRRRRSCFSPWL